MATVTRRMTWYELVKNVAKIIPLFALVPFACQTCRAQSAPTIVTGHGYRITIFNPIWSASSYPETDLSFSFSIQRADGSPVKFLTKENAVKVCGWTDEGFDDSILHTTNAYYDSNSGSWVVGLTGISSHAKTAHIEFDIRDPKTSQWQTENLNSDFQFDNVPVPTEFDKTVPLNDTFTTNWGTVITLKGFTLVSKGRNNGSQPQSRFDFVVDHSKIPDDSMQLQIQKGFNNGVAIDGFWQSWNDATKSSFIAVTGGPIEPGSLPAASFDFLMQENSYFPIKSIAWTPLQIDLPLTGLTAPSGSASVAEHGAGTFGSAQYRIEHIKTNQSWNDSYLIWTQYSDPLKPFVIKAADWTAEPGAQPWQNQSPSLTKSVYWHVDGSPTGANEHGALVQMNGRHGNFPLLLTAKQIVHEQHQLIFHNIPVPVSGQSILLRRPSDNAPSIALRLKSISLNQTTTDSNGQRNSDSKQAYTLHLTFQYVDTDNSDLSLAVVTARDDENNEVDPNLLVSNPGINDPGSVDPTQRIFTVEIPVPPHGSKVISLKTIFTKNTPIGKEQKLSVDEAGKWTLLPDFVPPTPTQQANQQAQEQPNGPSPAPLTSQPNKGYLVTVSNAKWQASTLAFNIEVNHGDGTPVKFLNPARAVSVVGWGDANFDSTVNRMQAANFDSGSGKWNVNLHGIDPRSSIAHLEFDIRDPDATALQTDSLSSDIRINDVPVPTKLNTTVPLNKSFTTDYGTKVTLTGITLTPQSMYGQPSTLLNFTVDRANVPDDAVDMEFQKGFDNGVQINNLYQQYSGNQNAEGNNITAVTGLIDHDLHPSASFDLTFNESAYTPIQTLKWTPVTLDIPLKAIPETLSENKDAGTTKTDGNAQYRFDKYVSSQSYGGDTTYLLWATSSAPNKIYRITKADWSIDYSYNRGYYPPTVVRNGAYWHNNGTPVVPGESGVLIRQDSSNGANFPITFISQEATHEQKLASFSKIPIPTLGKTIILDQKPDNADTYPIKLRAISWDTVDLSQGFRPVPTTLHLTFEYNVADSSIISVGVLSARDDQGNTVNLKADPNNDPDVNGIKLDSNMQTVVEDIQIPPTGAKTIDLSTMLTKDTPTAPPITYQIDKLGTWTTLSSGH